MGNFYSALFGYQNDNTSNNSSRSSSGLGEETEVPYLLKVAIDFGTTHSGYGLAFNSNKNDILVNKVFNDSPSSVSYKAPTCVLIDNDRKFVSFGFEAENDYYKYLTRTDDEDYENFQLYSNFKMKLYKNEELTRETEIKSVTGVAHPAMDIFAMALEYFKKHLTENIERLTVNKIEAKQIQWVLTIPAIWSNKAKQFMREAAFKAGLIPDKDSRQLLFALEPEAASVFIKSLEVNNLKGVPLKMMDVDFSKGTKYMIIDAGGGTIDITAHKVMSDRKLIEIICATGGPWGGEMVNKNFENYFSEILGQDFMVHFKIHFPVVWLQMINEFELKKRDVKVGGKTVNISANAALTENFKKYRRKELKDVLGKSYNNGYIIISNAKVLEFFKPVLEEIVNHVKELFTKYEGQLRDLKYIFMVGGFSDSALLFNRIKEDFATENRAVLAPCEALLGIVKGAVMFGYNPQVIVARIMKKTYGQGVEGEFIAAEHDPEKKVVDEYGNDRCKDLFQVFARKDELIPINSSKKYIVAPTKINSVSAGLYSTDKTEVMYKDEQGVTKIGELSFPIEVIPGKTIYQRHIETRVYFGHTEIEIEYKDLDVENSLVHHTHIDFLKN